MKKLFSKFSKSGKDSESKAAQPNPRESTKSAASTQLAAMQAEMLNYKGQRYNPAEDDGITTESLFQVIDGDTGMAIDVRELLGVTEEEFRANPELRDAIAHMNKIKPIDERPRMIEEESKESGVLD